MDNLSIWFSNCVIIKFVNRKLTKLITCKQNFLTSYTYLWPCTTLAMACWRSFFLSRFILKHAIDVLLFRWNFCVWQSLIQFTTFRSVNFDFWLTILKLQTKLITLVNLQHQPFHSNESIRWLMKPVATFVFWLSAWNATAPRFQKIANWCTK